MFEQLKDIEATFEENERLLCDPAVLCDQKRVRDLNRQQKRTLPVVEAYRERKMLEPA